MGTIPRDIQVRSIIEHIAKTYNSTYLIHGSFGTKYFIEGSSDIDVLLFTKSPEVIYHRMCNEFKYDKLDHCEYSFNKSKSNVYYKINTVIQGIQTSFMIIPKEDEELFRKRKADENKVVYYFGFILYLLKYLHYKLNLITKPVYKGIKKIFFDIPFFHSLDYNYKNLYTYHK